MILKGGTHAALTAVSEERKRQDAQWGGSDHDDEHERVDWLRFVDEHVRRARRAVNHTGDLDEYRQQMVEIAALCVAAIESHDRKARQ